MADNAEGKTRMRGWLKVVFGLSLALNLLVLGAIGGAVLRHGSLDGRHHPPRADMVGGPLTRALSREDKRAVAGEMRRIYREEGRAGRAAYGEAMRELVAVLKSEPFDPAQAEARMDRMRDMMGKRVALGQRILLDHLARMDAPARQAFAERLDEAMARRWKGRE